MRMTNRDNGTVTTGQFDSAIKLTANIASFCGLSSEEHFAAITFTPVPVPRASRLCQSSCCRENRIVMFQRLHNFCIPNRLEVIALPMWLLSRRHTARCLPPHADNALDLIAAHIWSLAYPCSTAVCLAAPSADGLTPHTHIVRFGCHFARVRRALNGTATEMFGGSARTAVFRVRAMAPKSSAHDNDLPAKQDIANASKVVSVEWSGAKLIFPTTAVD